MQRLTTSGTCSLFARTFFAIAVSKITEMISQHTSVHSSHDGRGALATEEPAKIGKVASALLAKHVRTLEVLYSLQQENIRLRREAQVIPLVEAT